MSTIQPFTSANTLYDFMQLNDENKTSKQINRYLRKVNSVIVDDGFAFKIVCERRSSTKLKLSEHYGPLSFSNYIDPNILYNYISYKLANKAVINVDALTSKSYDEKMLEFTDVKLDIIEPFEPFLNKYGLHYIFENKIIRLFTKDTNDDDIIIAEITINDFGRGSINHFIENLCINDLDILNSNNLLMIADITRYFQSIDYQYVNNLHSSIEILSRNASVNIEELAEETEIKRYMDSGSDDPIVIKNRGNTIILQNKSRIKLELTVENDDNLLLYRRTFKGKEMNGDTLYDLVKHVAALS